VINAPTDLLLGRPLIGKGINTSCSTAGFQTLDLPNGHTLRDNRGGAPFDAGFVRPPATTSTRRGTCADRNPDDGAARRRPGAKPGRAPRLPTAPSPVSRPSHHTGSGTGYSHDEYQPARLSFALSKPRRPVGKLRLQLGPQS
jgi:hypothetical protein